MLHGVFKNIFVVDFPGRLCYNCMLDLLYVSRVSTKFLVILVILQSMPGCVLSLRGDDLPGSLPPCLMFVCLFNFKPEEVCRHGLDSLTKSLKALCCRPRVPRGHTRKPCRPSVLSALYCCSPWARLLIAFCFTFPICALPVLHGDWPVYCFHWGWKVHRKQGTLFLFYF